MLEVGDRLVVEDKMFDGFEFVYAGLSSPQSFSLLCKERQIMRTRMSGNIYFPVDSKEIVLKNYRFEVINVSPNSISLRHANRRIA